MTLRQAILVGAGAGLGAVSRVSVQAAALRVWPGGFWTGTLIVNLLGCFGIGLVMTELARRPGADWLSLLLVAGFLGGFTTFSTFAMDLHRLLESPRVASGYVTASVVGGFLACALGVMLAQRWAQTT